MNQKLKKNVLLPIAFLLLATISNAQLTVTLTPNNVNCEGLRTGQITANVTGGVPPYQYKWSNGEATQSISNLHGGYYHCYIVDASGTMAEKEITLTEPEEFRIVQFDATIYSNNYNTSCYNCNDGAIIVAVAGGTPPYTYTWSDGSNLQNRTNLVAKDYQLVVTDAFGCQVRELNKELSRPEREDWTAGGNANATSASFLGTTNQMPLQFKAGNNLGFTLMPNANALFTGKIGIGTTAPSEKFEVAGGNAKFGGDVKVLGDARLTNGKLLMGNTGNEGITFNTSGSGVQKNVYIGPITTQPLNTCLYPVTDWNITIPSSLEIRTASGYAGGGDHLMKLFCDGGNAHIDVTGNNGSTSGPNLLMNYYCGKDIFMCTGLNGGKVIIGSNQNTDAFEVKGKSFFDGKVGIGLNPMSSYVLAANGSIAVVNNGVVNFRVAQNGNTEIVKNGAVNFRADNDGNVYARKVEVRAIGISIPDYVFDKKYNLLSLPKLDEFINKYHHLPNIPSAQEYNDKGVIDINELQLKLLQKIEELSLYVIQQQKEIETLKAKMK